MPFTVLGNTAFLDGKCSHNHGTQGENRVDTVRFRMRIFILAWNQDVGGNM